MRGRSFNIFSTSAIRVSRVSSFTIWVPKSERRIFRIEWLIRSQTPPAWLACRWLKFHLIPHLLRQLSIRSGFQCSKAVLISESAPLKLVPLSLKTSIGEPRLLTNLVKAWINESAVRSWAISMCTARIAKHVNTNPYLFTWLRLDFTNIGPKPTTRTRSPTARFGRGRSHFCLTWSVGKYQSIHRFQNISARYWACFHAFSSIDVDSVWFSRKKRCLAARGVVYLEWEAQDRTNHLSGGGGGGGGGRVRGRSFNIFSTS